MALLAWAAAALGGCEEAGPGAPIAPLGVGGSPGDDPGPDALIDPDAAPAPAACDDESTLDLFRRHVEPLITDERPSSCNQCHAAGTHLSLFVRGTPCQSMACLVDRGLVDLSAPEDSELLGFIRRGIEDGDGQLPPEVAEAEYAGFLEWITHSARCHADVCGAIEAPCGPAPDAAVTPPVVDAGPPPADAAPIADARPDDPADTGAPSDLDAATDDAALTALDAAPPADFGVPPRLDGGGVCEPGGLEGLLHERIMRWHGRCEHCHVPNAFLARSYDPPPPVWLSETDDLEGARETFANIVARGLVNTESPEESLILLKPLAENLGGVPHRGGAKFRGRDDPAFVDFLFWIERYAACGGGGPAEPDHADAGAAADVGPRTPVEAYCDCMVTVCHDRYHALWGEDEVQARGTCLELAGALPAEGAGDSLACRARYCERGVVDISSCLAATGGPPCRAP